MALMVRKQIYLEKRQEEMLKRQAKELGTTEAELIRQAIDRQFEHGVSSSVRPDPAAWERALDFMMALHAQGPLPGRPRRWTREEIYEERTNRYGHRSR